MFARGLICSWIGAFGLAAGAFCQGSFVTFGVEGANTTLPYSINEKGAIAGLFLSVPNFGAVHGFVREPDGTITNFDPPDGRLQLPLLQSPGRPLSINAAGAIAGYYLPNNSAANVLGFIREPEGTFTSFNLPGALHIFNVSINAGGAVTGTYQEIQGPDHAFVRHPNGRITLFDFPGSDFTVAVSINAKGAIAGYYGALNGYHGFVREPGGEFLSLTEPAIQPAGINYSGAITGSYLGAGGPTGFARDRHGNFTSFRADNYDTLPTSINDGGAITGSATEHGSSSHGFVRTSHGTITLFDVPVGCALNSTSPQSVNNAGAVTGSCTANLPPGFIGFLRLP